MVTNEVIKDKKFHTFYRGYMMEIKINLQENSSHISNLAFMKELMIKQAIEELNVSYEEKGRLRKEVLEYLKKT